MDDSQTSYEIGGNDSVAETDPLMRAYYSSSPAFLEGASERPDGPVDIQMAVVLDSTSQSPNGKSEEILHAVRLMKLREESEQAGGQNFVILDHGLALKGLRWIRKNVKDNDIHRSTIESLKHVRPEPEPEPVEPMPQAEAAPRPEPKNNRREKRIEIELERQAAQDEHKQQRQAEIEQVAKWQEEHPPEGTNHLVKVTSSLDTLVNPRGKILILEKEDFAPQVRAFINTVVRNPQQIYSEFNDSDNLSSFINENGLTIFRQLQEYAVDKAAEIWKNTSFTSPDELKAVLPKWLDLFSNFSEEYRLTVNITSSEIDNYFARNKPAPLPDEAYLTDYGTRVIHTSLIKLAESHPEEFLDLVYNVADQALDAGDEFTTRSILFAVRAALAESQIAETLMLHAPIARNLDEESKLKAVDLYLMLRAENGFLVKKHPKKGGRKAMPRQVGKMYGEVWKTAVELGISPQTRNYTDKIRRILLPPMMEQIEQGALSDSLYIKAKDQGLATREY